MNPIQSWLGQVTTGLGATVLLPTVLAVLSHQMTWETATPLIVGSVVGLLWPENTGAKSAATQLATDAVKDAPTIISDVNAMLQVYHAGIAHGAAGTVTVAPPKPAA